MKVPFVDLISQYNSIKSEIDSKINQVVSTASFIGGKYVDLFEKEFAKKIGAKHCISVANGTDSLYIIMKMLGIGRGDEVITVANSWISSSETISQSGAKVVFIDIDPNFYVIDESKIEKKITDNTKAIIPVHLYGHPCNMDEIMRIAKKYNLYVIEDCAQSHFAKFSGKNTGLFGVASSFSFFPGKNLGAFGDAGCIITNDDDLAVKFRMFARHGGLKKHQHIIEGINSRMDNLQAAVLCVKLKYIEKWTEQRIKIASKYEKLLKSNSNIILPKVRKNSKHVFHVYVIRAKNRDKLKFYLEQNNISTSIHYPKILPELDAYKYLSFDSNEFENASKFQYQILSLPMYPELDDEKLGYIVKHINEFYKK